MSPEANNSLVHVLHVTDNLKVGGVQKVVTNLAHMLISASIETSIAASPEGPLWDTVSPHVRKYFAPPRIGVRAKIRYLHWLRRTIRESGCTVVHAHQRGVALNAKIATLFTKIPVVEHVHSIFHDKRFLSFRGDLLIACGSSVARVLMDTYKKKNSRVLTILNSVPDLAPYGTNNVPSSQGALPKIIGIGRLTEVKDPLKFVRLVSQLNSGTVPVVEAVWLGDGELRQEAEELARTLGCTGLTFLGNQADVTSHILDSDLLVMTSQREGLPLAVLETMSLGRGVIVPDVGSCGDAVIPGQNGLLYDPEGDLMTLVEVVRSAISPSNLDTWGANSRRMYLDKFHPDSTLPTLLAAYDKVTQQKRSTSYVDRVKRSRIKTPSSSGT